MAMKTWLADVLRSAGLKVEEAEGWKTAGQGEMGAVRGILCHHTAGPKTGDRPSLNIVKNGRPDLKGPLSQLFLTRAGVFVVLAAGRCNHAGAGSWQGVTTGNSSFIGIEAENAGVAGDPWPSVQMDAYVRGCAAILSYLQIDAVWCAGHKEYATPRGRKIDPTFDMIDFREDVAAAMDGTLEVAPQARPTDPKRSMLRKGDSGKSVEMLQAALGRFEALVLKTVPTVIVDGQFGPTTERAVKQFQHKNGLAADGLVGPATWASLDAW